MTHASRPAPATIDDLTEAIDRFNDELRSISDLLEQVRTDLQWGLQNERVAFVLSEVEPLDQCRKATTGEDALTLAIQFHVALGQVREQLLTAIAGSVDESQVAETSTIDGQATTDETIRLETPSIELFEAGDAVEFELEGDIYFGEIVTVDDAGNSALVQLIPSYEEIEVTQDLLIRVEPDELSRREEIWRQIMHSDHETFARPQQPAVGDRVRLNLHGHDLEGEVNTIQRLSRTAEVVLTPSMETITVDWSDLTPLSSRPNGPSSVFQETIEPLSDRMAEHDRWCHKVRDPAQANSEGTRIVMPANGKALVEYDVAPLPNGEWAVRWGHRFLCGNMHGAGHPWTVRPTRDDCIDLVLQTSRKMFSAKSLDKVQIPVAREMLHLLGDGLFGFNEPDPEPPDDPDLPRSNADIERAVQGPVDSTA